LGERKTFLSRIRGISAAQTTSTLNLEHHASNGPTALWNYLENYIIQEAKAKDLVCHHLTTGRNKIIKVEKNSCHLLTLCRTPSALELWLRLEEPSRRSKPLGLVPAVWRGWYSLKITHATHPAHVKATQEILAKALNSFASPSS